MAINAARRIMQNSPTDIADRLNFSSLNAIRSLNLGQYVSQYVVPTAAVGTAPGGLKTARRDAVGKCNFAHQIAAQQLHALKHR
jgi:hypothetical protein